MLSKGIVNAYRKLEWDGEKTFPQFSVRDVGCIDKREPAVLAISTKTLCGIIRDIVRYNS